MERRPKRELAVVNKSAWPGLFCDLVARWSWCRFGLTRTVSQIVFRFPSPSGPRSYVQTSYSDLIVHCQRRGVDPGHEPKPVDGVPMTPIEDLVHATVFGFHWATQRSGTFVPEAEGSRAVAVADDAVRAWRREWPQLRAKFAFETKRRRERARADLEAQARARIREQQRRAGLASLQAQGELGIFRNSPKNG